MGYYGNSSKVEKNFQLSDEDRWSIESKIDSTVSDIIMELLGRLNLDDSDVPESLIGDVELAKWHLQQCIQNYIESSVMLDD